MNRKDNSMKGRPRFPPRARITKHLPFLPFGGLAPLANLSVDRDTLFAHRAFFFSPSLESYVQECCQLRHIADVFLGNASSITESTDADHLASDSTNRFDR